MRQVVWEYPAIRLNKSVLFTSSASGVVDKLLVSNLGLKQLDEVSVFRKITILIIILLDQLHAKILQGCGCELQILCNKFYMEGDKLKICYHVLEFRGNYL